MKNGNMRIIKMAAIIISLVILASIFTACDNTDYFLERYNVYNSAAEVENMSDKQLLEEVYLENKFYISDFYKPDDFGVKLKENEWWHQLQLNSVDTVEEARNEVDSFALMQNPASYTIDYIGENEYYYQFSLTYSAVNVPVTYIFRVIVYKESAKYCTFNSQDGYYYEIRALNKKAVLELCDLNTFFSVASLYSERVLYREISETEDEYIYTLYAAYIIGGDWGIDDTACLVKGGYKIDKISGEITRLESQTLKEVVIFGTAKDMLWE